MARSFSLGHHSAICGMCPGGGLFLPAWTVGRIRSARPECRRGMASRRAEESHRQQLCHAACQRSIGSFAFVLPLPDPASSKVVIAHAGCAMDVLTLRFRLSSLSWAHVLPRL